MYKTHRELVKEKRKKRIIFFFSITITIWICIGLYLTINHKKYDTKLKKIGYSTNEINVIQNILTNKQTKTLYKYEYIDILLDILLNNNYKNDKLDNYIKYYNKNKKVNIDDLIYIINNNYDDIPYNSFSKKIIYKKDFIYENYERYEKYYKKYNLSIDDTMNAVNKDFDKYDIEYNTKYLEYFSKDYFIVSNLKRYISYKDKNKNKSIDSIIEEVNCNLDIKDIKDADTNKGILILVNNYYKLNKDYSPTNLVKIDNNIGKGMLEEETYINFKKMYEDAKKDGIKLKIIRGYTSYSEQSILYNKNKAYYRKPGYSEFQTGLMIELSYNEWLEKNAHEYGFILRYPESKKNITGIYNKNYYRYVGNDISKFIYKHNITYEEYYAYFIEDK